MKILKLNCVNKANSEYAEKTEEKKNKRTKHLIHTHFPFKYVKSTNYFTVYVEKWMDPRRKYPPHTQLSEA